MSAEQMLLGVARGAAAQRAEKRYRLPDPICKHVRRGIVRAGDIDGVYASTSVCGRAACIEDAIIWARRMTQQEPEFRLDGPRVAP